MNRVINALNLLGKTHTDNRIEISLFKRNKAVCISTNNIYL